MDTFSIDGKQLDVEAIENFSRRVRIDGEHWHWIGSLGAFPAGTVNVRVAGEVLQVSAKRFSFAAANGGIGKGQRVRATCLDPMCIKPEHLELVPQVESPDFEEVLVRLTGAVPV
jgi:hypothetical protein